MRFTTIVGAAMLTMLSIAGCSSPPTSAAVAYGTPDHTTRWHGPVKNITSLGTTQALFDPVESPGVYYKLSAANYVSGSSDLSAMTLTPYVGSTITVTFQKEGSGVLWGAVLSKP
jgi:hypothetical protein